MQTGRSRPRTSVPTPFRYYLYDGARKEFVEIRNGTVCGRFEGDLRFPGDDLLSRRHCQFHVLGNEVYVEDFGTTNHTRVNTVDIQPLRRRRIRLNDVIEIGSQRFILSGQNRYPPGPTVDLATRHAIFKGLQRNDGSVTIQMTGMVTRRTMVRLGREDFVRLRMRKTARAAAGPAATLMMAAIAAAGVLAGGAAIGLEGASLETVEIGKTLTTAAGAAALIAALWHALVIGRARRGTAIRAFLGLLSSGVIAAGTLAGVAHLPALLEQASRRPSSAPAETACAAAPGTACAPGATGTGRSESGERHRSRLRAYRPEP